MLAVHTGLSKGELLALKWDNVNLEVGMLQAWRTLVKTNGGPVLAAPKTRSSRRSVKLTGSTTDALRSHLERQQREIEEAAGSHWQENGFIFASETGELLDVTSSPATAVCSLSVRVSIADIHGFVISIDVAQPPEKVGVLVTGLRIELQVHRPHDFYVSLESATSSSLNPKRFTSCETSPAARITAMDIGRKARSFSIVV